VIRLDGVSVTYPGSAGPAIRDVDLHVPEGELALVVGHTGVGKSTLLKLVNGLVPHFTGGHLDGRVLVAGRDTRTHPPRELVDVVGVVLQNPLHGFVSDTVEDELAYGMESLGLASDTMRRRVEETLDLLGLADLRDRALRTLSAGQQQRVAIGAVLTTHPKVLVLDEPTSALDPGAAEDVLAALQRLVHDLGLTVLLAEHRLERVVQFADRLVVVGADGTVCDGPTREMLLAAPVAPPVVELGRRQGWLPVPVTVREARRAAARLRAACAAPAQAAVPPPEAAPQPVPPRVPPRVPPTVPHTGPQAVPPETVSGTAAGPPQAPAEATVVVHGLTVRHGAVAALAGVDLQVGPGEVVAVMGRNGAGKTTLLRCLVGLSTSAGGRARVVGRDPHQLAGPDRVGIVGLVPADPADLLWAESVAQECQEADSDAHAPRGSARALFDELAGDVDPATHPRDLSEGQRLALALAVVLAADPQVLLLDEPTRGLDYAAKARLVALLRTRAAAGRTVMLATHDVELVADVATRVVVVADGEVVADGATREVVTSSPQFAPQVAKVMAPQPWLTVTEVDQACRAAS
jgi:energy-coupling factor transport system ATP-binding protein